MTLETRVLVNGQWTTRNVDIHHILARNKISPQEQETEMPAETVRPPVIGVLTRKLVQSPVVKLIVPARIRHKDRNDVLFISEDFIEIKELLRDGYLQDVMGRADFGSKIRSARAIGEPRRPAVSPEPTGIDAIVKMEDVEPTEVEHSPLHALPPQILVLTLESNTLVFLFADYGLSNQNRFILHSRPLADDGRYTKRPGKLIAVDPQ